MSHRFARPGRALDADVVAFGALYDEHARAVYALAYRMLRDRGAAEDVAQEAFLSVWRSRHAYDAALGSTRTWLLAVTRHRAIDALRRRRSHLVLDGEPFELEAPDRTDEEALRAEDAAAVRHALLDLPDGQRRVVELAYFDGLSQTEIAARMLIPLGTVKGRMRLALEKLASTLEAPALVAG